MTTTVKFHMGETPLTPLESSAHNNSAHACNHSTPLESSAHNHSSHMIVVPDDARLLDDEERRDNVNEDWRPRRINKEHNRSRSRGRSGRRRSEEERRLSRESNNGHRSEVTEPKRFREETLDGIVDTKPLVAALKELDVNLQKSIDKVTLSARGDGGGGGTTAGSLVGGLSPSTVSPYGHAPAGNFDRKDKVIVHTRLVFLKLGEINTVNEKFAADAFVQARWLEPLLDGQDRSCEHDLARNNPYWNPKLSIENGHGDVKESVWYTVRYDEQGKASICEKRRVKGTFFEKMELMEYPFDTQDLTITITTERGEAELSIQADTGELSSVNVQSFVDEQEWYLHKHINHWTKITTNAYRNTKHKHPSLSVSCKATRRFQFFFWNIILVMVFICSLVFSTFAVSYTLVQNRLQLSFILLLSNITFKFTVSQTLPKVSYLTYLDKYILTSMFIQCVVCAWHGIVVACFPVEEEALLADKIALGVLASIFFTFNAGFLIWSKLLWRKSQGKKFVEFRSTILAV